MSFCSSVKRNITLLPLDDFCRIDSGDVPDTGIYSQSGEQCHADEDTSVKTDAGIDEGGI